MKYFEILFPLESIHYYIYFLYMSMCDAIKFHLLIMLFFSFHVIT